MNSLNNTFNAVLDAASASVASVTPRDSSRVATTSESKSRTFVSFDDLVADVKGGVSLATGGVVATDLHEGAGAEGLGALDEESVDVDEETAGTGWKSEESVTDAPYLVLVGSAIGVLCGATPFKTSKWCYDCEDCPIKSHARYPRFEMDKGLYVKAKGPSLLAFTDPFVPFEFVWNKGYVQELLYSEEVRSVGDWEYLFEVINVTKGDFGSLAELEARVEELKLDACSFTTPAKRDTSRSVKMKVEGAETEGSHVEEDKVRKGILGQLKETVTRMAGTNFDTEEGKKQLWDVLLTLVNHAASNDSLKDVESQVDILQRQQEVTMAKVIDMLSSIGIRKEGRGVQQNLYSELSNLVDEVLDLSKRMKDLERKYKLMSMFETNQSRMEDTVKNQFEKIAKIFQNLLSKQELLDKELEQIKENF